MGSSLYRLTAILKSAVVVLLGSLTLSAGAVRAQDARPKSLVRVGYSRPGSPTDLFEAGKVRPLAHDPAFKGKLIGATVYFAVLERAGIDGDNWGTGMAGFDRSFLLGKNPQNNFSPRLDTKARYLYLYQIVNDRGMDPMEVRPAVDHEPPVRDIAGFGLMLPVESKNITSWGHFKDSSFTMMTEQAAGKDIRLAASAADSVLAKLPEKRYQAKSPAYSPPELRQSLGFGAATMNLMDSVSYQALQKKMSKDGAKLVAFEENFLQAAKGAREPEFVEILAKTEKNEAEFHALWKDTAAIKLGQHSVLIGFTSDLAPADEKAQIEAADVLKGGAVRPVSTNEGEVAQATLPAPQMGMHAAAGAKARTPIRSGFTKPGNPPDELTAEGKIRPIAFVGGGKQKIIGGTVYFSVFERANLGADGDPLGTGLGNLEEMFSEGYSFQGSFSPHLDSRGRYLYLYQIVNDRGLDRSILGVGGIAPALDDRKELNTTDIAGYALRLSVDPRYITSWGYFKNAAFTTAVPNRNMSGEITPAVDGGDSKIALAVSSFQPILSDIPVKRYGNRSPAYPLPSNMVATWGVGPATLNLKIVEDHKQLTRMHSEGTKLVGFEKNKLSAATQAKHPDFVQVLYGQTDGQADERGYLDNMGEIGPVVFRADFRNPLKPGEHSVVFGFTTDLPPQDEPLRIEEKLPVPGGIRAVVGGGEGIAPGTGIAPAVGAGVAPGPIPAAPQAAGGVAGALGGISPGAMGGGIGGGMPLGGGGIGGARAPGTGGGGGFAGGGGRGNGEGDSNENQNQKPTTQINFDATLTNQQQQQQKQQQQQSQSNCCCCDSHGNVVPEPGSVLLALLGAPGLFWLWRRQKTAVVTD